MADNEPRAYTEEECREIFLGRVRDAIKYWAAAGRGDLSVQDRLEGVVHTIFATLDGSTLDFPRFTLSPFPYPEDQDLCKEEGANWFPDAGDQVDIGGHLRYFLRKKEGGS